MNPITPLKALPAALLALGLAMTASAQTGATASSAPGGTTSAGTHDPHTANPTTATTTETTRTTMRDKSGKPEGAKLSHADRKFIEEAAKGGMAEVELGKIAAERASNPQVKQFAQRMVTDHSKANEELRQLAEQKGVTVPADTKHAEKREADKLAKLQGDEFDRKYMDHMVKDHKKDVKEFQKEADKAKDNDVRAFAQKTLPTLQEHMKMAQDADAAVGGKKGTGTKTGRKTTAKTAG